MSNKGRQITNLIKSTKSESPEEKEQNNDLFVDQPQQFEKLLEKDIKIIKIKEEPTKEKNESNKEINEKEKNYIKNKEIKENEEQDLNEKIEGNRILIDDKNNKELIECNLNIDLEKNNRIKENNENEKNEEIKNNIEKSASNRKSKFKYFDEINNSSIARKEESNFDYNISKKSQGSDSLFKIMNEIGNQHSKIKTIESLDKLNPFTSINSQNTAFANKHEDYNKIGEFLKSISEPEAEDEEKSNEDNIIKTNNNKIKKIYQKI